jgi:hypothetical protein
MKANTLDVEILDLKTVLARDSDADESYISFKRMAHARLIDDEFMKFTEQDNYLIRIYDIERKTELKDFFALKKVCLI